MVSSEDGNTCMLIWSFPLQQFHFVLKDMPRTFFFPYLSALNVWKSDSIFAQYAENVSYILTQAFHIISQSNHIPFQFFCSKLKIAVFMCQTWQLAVHTLAHAVKWSRAVGHAHCVQAREDTSFWKHKWSNCTTFLSLLPIPICTLCLAPLHAVQRAELCLLRWALWEANLILCTSRQFRDNKKRSNTLQRYNSTPSVHAWIHSNQWFFPVCKVYTAIKPWRPEPTVENWGNLYATTKFYDCIVMFYS